LVGFIDKLFISKYCSSKPIFSEGFLEFIYNLSYIQYWRIFGIHYCSALC
jgi:hypothetical protein